MKQFDAKSHTRHGWLFAAVLGASLLPATWQDAAARYFDESSIRERVKSFNQDHPELRNRFKDGYPEAAPMSERVLTVKELTQQTIKLRGVSTSQSINFTNEVDSIVKDLDMTLTFSHSPSLLSRLSHIKVYLNEEIMAVLPIKHSNEKEQDLGEDVTYQVDLDAKLVADFNALRFELIGHYTLECEDPFHSSIWVDIDSRSKLAMKSQLLAIESDLARFPEPFFDARDYSPLVLPMHFTQAPNTTMIKAASVLASWFGGQSRWRGSDFPVNYDTIPVDHAVVFMTNDTRPHYLRDYPHADKPSIDVISNPYYRYKKLLVINGPDEAAVLDAVTGLVFGKDMMVGRVAEVLSLPKLDPRKAYDAPYWLPSDRPVRFDELTEFENQLQAQGYVPAPISLDVQLPPDLFTWKTDGLPMDLKYRYTPPSDNGSSRLNVFINEQFTQGYILENDNHSRLDVANVTVPLSANNLNIAQDDVDVPGFKVDAANKLQFQYLFNTDKEGHCRAAPVGGTVGSIDGSSTLDISDFHHYVALPELAIFANGAFPYSKWADLSQTQLILDTPVSTGQLHTALNLLGHIGATTGYPSVGLHVSHNLEGVDASDKDILFVTNHATSQKVVTDEKLANLIAASKRRVTQALMEKTPAEFDTLSERPIVQVNSQSLGPIAAITAMQSPFDDERSVITVMASHDNAFGLVTDVLRNKGELSAVKGTTTIVNEHGLRTSYLGERYYVGDIPLYLWLWFNLADHPFILAFISLVTLILLAFILWRLLNVAARKRLAEGDN